VNSAQTGQSFWRPRVGSDAVVDSVGPNAWIAPRVGVDRSATPFYSWPWSAYPKTLRFVRFFVREPRPRAPLGDDPQLANSAPVNDFAQVRERIDTALNVSRCRAAESAYARDASFIRPAPHGLRRRPPPGSGQFERHSESIVILRLCSRGQRNQLTQLVGRAAEPRCLPWPL